MTVNITKNQVVDLLRLSLCSKTVLTDLFLEKLPGERLLKRKRIVLSDFQARDSGKITVKIMQRKSNRKIVFAEGNEDFADFLFSLLTIPLGGAVHLTKGFCYFGSVDGLYRSVVDLDDKYWITKEVKNKVVAPVLAAQFKRGNLLPLMCDVVPNYFCYVNIEDHFIERIKVCYLTSTRKKVNSLVESCVASVFVDPLSDSSNNVKGYAKGPTRYMATDDLVVTPSSSFSVMSLLNSMDIPVHDLKEKVVSIGKEEVVRTLQALCTTSALSTLSLSHLTKVKEECLTKVKEECLTKVKEEC
ncbi:hypothetical protein DEO72_LG10g2310 [Vigna unguiculata]|uniref:DUF674 domain-containing protein n=1 Tax=Vigna unguiculata TaxID=3917 RepID=A0A4D6NGL4_VIGUN|nr:hypothetical protein DEO72_LG10g2310 [Vigna unguiculata]